MPIAIDMKFIMWSTYELIPIPQTVSIYTLLCVVARDCILASFGVIRYLFILALAQNSRYTPSYRSLLFVEAI